MTALAAVRYRRRFAAVTRLNFSETWAVGAADINKAAANFRLIKQNCAPQERHAAALLFLFLSVVVIAVAVVIAAAAIVIEIELEQSAAVGAVNASVLKDAVVDADSLAAVGALDLIAIVVACSSSLSCVLVDIALKIRRDPRLFRQPDR